MSDEIFVDDPEILQEFITESLEHLESTEPVLIQLEEDPKNLDLLNEVFRSVHSVKGSAGFLGLNAIQSLSHKMEGVLDDLRKGKREITPDVMDLIFETSDVLKDMIQALRGESVVDGFLTEEGKTRHDALINKILTLTGGTVADKVAAEVEEKEKKKEQEKAEFEEKIKPKTITKTKTKAKAKTKTKTKEKVESFESLKDSKKMLELFVIETDEHIHNIEKDLLEIEKDPENFELINGLFRAYHSIKGSAAYVNKLTISEFSHSVENLLNVLRSNKIPVSKEMLDILFKSLDLLKLMAGNAKSMVEDPPNVLEIVDAIKLKLVEIINGITTEEQEQEQEQDEEEGGADDAMDDVFLDSASQYIESSLFCLNNIKEGNLSEENTETFIRAIESLKKSAEFMGFDEIAKAAELAFDTLTFVKGGQLSFEKEIIELLDDKLLLLSKNIKSSKVLRKAPEPPKEKLGDLLVEDGAVSKEVIDEALGKQKKLGEILKEEGAAKEDDIQKALETQKKRATAGGVAKKVEEIKTVRVDQHKIDKFMNLVGELIITRNSLFYLIGQLDSDKSHAEALKEIKYATSVIYRISDELQTNVMNMRMVPIKTVFQRFPRMVRDIARKKDKKVELKMVGEDTEIDKTVAELLGDPLVHLVRNSVDHGVETPEERAAAGKSETGTVILKASQEGNVIIVEIIDDGAGMDPEKLKRKAVDKELITEEEAEAMPDKDALNLIFRAGLSTAKQVTDISGRGVGMDVVKTNITKLKGRIDLSSDLGTGSKIRIELPLTLAIIKVLLIESKKEVFAMPLDSVVESVKIMPHEIIKLRGKDVISLRGEILGITKLSYLLGYERRNGKSIHSAITDQLEVATAEELHELAKENEKKQLGTASDKSRIPIVILDVLDHKIGIVVDKLHQQQEVVIKPMESYLADIPGIGGATIMGDGRVVLILDPIELVHSATSI